MTKNTVAVSSNVTYMHAKWQKSKTGCERKKHLKKLFKHDETINPQIQKVHWTPKQDKHKPHYTKAHHNQIAENLEWGEAKKKKKNQTTCLSSIKHTIHQNYTLQDT